MITMTGTADDILECPNCGCADCRVIERRLRSGRTSKRLMCAHCGATFRDSRDGTMPTIYHRPIRCPKCGSKRCPTRATRDDKRYHECRKCGFYFCSLEIT